MTSLSFVCFIVASLLLSVANSSIAYGVSSSIETLAVSNLTKRTLAGEVPQTSSSGERVGLKRQSRRALRGRARKSQSSRNAPTANTTDLPSSLPSLKGKSCRSASDADLLPPLKRIIWRENYRQLVNATVGSGKEFASGMRSLKDLAKKNPGGFEVLVVGGRGDATVPTSIPTNQWLEIQGVGARVIFAWNYNATAWQTPGKPVPTGVVGKAVPLGLDFHTLNGARTQRGKTWWGEPRMSPDQQYAVLCNLRTEAPPSWAERPNRDRILAPFRTVSEPIRELFYESHRIPTRTSVWQAINKTGLADELNYKSRREIWAQMGNYGFVVSPVGHGLDTHRTWEALAMGAIVLTQSTPLDAMFADHQLPVYVLKSVEEWASLDLPKLKSIAGELAQWTEPAHLNPRLDSGFWFKKPDANTRRRLNAPTAIEL